MCLCQISLVIDNLHIKNTQTNAFPYLHYKLHQLMISDTYLNEISGEGALDKTTKYTPNCLIIKLATICPTL